MGWEPRNGQLYYYESHRVDGRVVKTYYGKGPLAQLMSQEMEERKMERAEDRRRIEEAMLKSGPAVAAGQSLHTVSSAAPFRRAVQTASSSSGPQPQTPPQSQSQSQTQSHSAPQLKSQSVPQEPPGDPADSRRVRELLTELQQGDRSHVLELEEWVLRQTKCAA